MPGTTNIVNGITQIGSGTGSILQYMASYNCCNGAVPSSSSPIWLGSIVATSTVFNYSVSLSKQVNNIIITIAGSNIGESFIFNTNSGTPSLTNLRSCGYSITGNTATATLEFAGGAGIYLLVSAASPFTSLNISGPGGGGGSVVSICMNGN
jgi:hypothetical protein